MYPFSKYLGHKGVPIWVLEGLSTYYMGTWSLWVACKASPQELFRLHDLNSNGVLEEAVAWSLGLSGRL